MKITDYFKKPFWVRRVPDTYVRPVQPHRTDNCYYFYPSGRSVPGEIYLTEEDFMREIEPSAHPQMAEMQSSCPVWAVKPDPKDPTKKKWAIDHYDDIEVTTFGVQKRGANAFSSHMAGKGFGIANETKNAKDIFDTLCSWRDRVGISTTAFMEVCVSLSYTCEALLYQFTTDNGKDIDYKVFSFLHGDRLFRHTDKKRNPVYVRKYSLEGRVAADIFTADRVQTWVAANDSGDDNSGWWDKVKGWVKRAGGVTAVGSRSEDGFVCIADVATQTPDNVNPCTYFRLPDLRSGSSQLNIESYERAATFVAEEYKEGAFPDMLIKAEQVVSLPPQGKFGRKVYGFKGSAENLKASSVEQIKPADASNIATLNLTTKWNDIKNTMMSVYIEPEILKSGADSSTTIKILFTPELQYCQLMWVYLFKPLKHAMGVFKELVGRVEDKQEQFNDLRISIYPDFWIPNNTSEEIENATKLVYAGVLSQENARSMLDLQYINDSKLVEQEKIRDLYLKAYTPLEAQADAESKFGASGAQEAQQKQQSGDGENPYEPTAKVDNNMDRKDISQ